jgi:hypothetical protein
MFQRRQSKSSPSDRLELGRKANLDLLTATLQFRGTAVSVLRSTSVRQSPAASRRESLRGLAVDGQEDIARADARSGSGTVVLDPRSERRGSASTKVLLWKSWGLGAARWPPADLAVAAEPPTTIWTHDAGMLKPMPLPSIPRVLMPILPRVSISGPPLLPGLIAASV